MFSLKMQFFSYVVSYTVQVHGKMLLSVPGMDNNIYTLLFSDLTHNIREIWLAILRAVVLN